MQNKYFKSLEDLGTGDLYFTRFHSCGQSGTDTVRAMKPGEMLVTFGWNVFSILESSDDTCMGTIVFLIGDGERIESEQKAINEYSAITSFVLAYHCCDFISTKSIPQRERSDFLKRCYEIVSDISRPLREEEKNLWTSIQSRKY